MKKEGKTYDERRINQGKVRYLVAPFARDPKLVVGLQKIPIFIFQRREFIKYSYRMEHADELQEIYRKLICDHSRLQQFHRHIQQYILSSHQA
jgi:hypothetical protein